jgi:hypothetical protein
MLSSSEFAEQSATIVEVFFRVLNSNEEVFNGLQLAVADSEENIGNFFDGANLFNKRWNGFSNELIFLLDSVSNSHQFSLLSSNLSASFSK